MPDANFAEVIPYAKKNYAAPALMPAPARVIPRP